MQTFAQSAPAPPCALMDDLAPLYAALNRVDAAIEAAPSWGSIAAYAPQRRMLIEKIREKGGRYEGR